MISGKGDHGALLILSFYFLNSQSKCNNLGPNAKILETNLFHFHRKLKNSGREGGSIGPTEPPLEAVTSVDPEGGGSGGPDPPWKITSYIGSIGNKQLYPPPPGKC